RRFHGFGERFYDGVDFSGVIISAQPEAQGGVDTLVGQPEGAQDVRALSLRLRARRSRRERDRASEGKDERLGFGAIDRDVEVAREAWLGGAVEPDAVDARSQPFEEAIAQGAQALRLSGGDRLRPQPGRLPEADDPGDVERARAGSFLLPTALGLRLQAKAGLAVAPYVEGADTLGPVHLVGRQAHEVHVPGLDVDG